MARQGGPGQRIGDYVLVVWGDGSSRALSMADYCMLSADELADSYVCFLTHEEFERLREEQDRAPSESEPDAPRSGRRAPRRPPR